MLLGDGLTTLPGVFHSTVPIHHITSQVHNTCTNKNIRKSTQTLQRELGFSIFYMYSNTAFTSFTRSEERKSFFAT